MARLCVQYLASYSNADLSNSLKMANKGSKFFKISPNQVTLDVRNSKEATLKPNIFYLDGLLDI